MSTHPPMALRLPPPSSRSCTAALGCALTVPNGNTAAVHPPPRDHTNTCARMCAHIGMGRSCARTHRPTGPHRPLTHRHTRTRACARKHRAVSRLRADVHGAPAPRRLGHTGPRPACVRFVCVTRCAVPLFLAGCVRPGRLLGLLGLARGGQGRYVRTGASRGGGHCIQLLPNSARSMRAIAAADGPHEHSAAEHSGRGAETGEALFADPTCHTESPVRRRALRTACMLAGCPFARRCTSSSFSTAARRHSLHAPLPAHSRVHRWAHTCVHRSRRTHARARTQAQAHTHTHNT
jgi:hypothetical protein